MKLYGLPKRGTDGIMFWLPPTFLEDGTKQRWQRAYILRTHKVIRIMWRGTEWEHTLSSGVVSDVWQWVGMSGMHSFNDDVTTRVVTWDHHRWHLATVPCWWITCTTSNQYTITSVVTWDHHRWHLATVPCCQITCTTSNHYTITSVVTWDHHW